MNKLDELIKELCPNGVKYRLLGKVCKIETGRLNANAAVEDGEYLFFTTAKEPSRINQYRWDTEALLIAGNANIGNVKYYIGKFEAYQRTYVLTDFDSSVSVKFLYYSLSNNLKVYLDSHKNEAAMVYIVLSTLQDFRIPVPPLPVQEEIVRTLDNFTELTAELTAELAARKKQYEYYRDEFYGHDYEGMLKMADNQSVKILPLSEVGTLKRGKRFVKADSEGLMSGVPCLHYGELYTYYGVSAEKPKSFVKSELAAKLRFASKGDVVIVGAGENNIDIGVGVAWFGDEDIAVHDACYTLTHNQNPKYISYYLRTNIYHSQIKKYVSEGKICSISASGLGKALIPIPSIEEQDRIVSILDKFDILTTDISAGLPAEIEARQKQYEYYRDKLLTFKELS